MLARWRSSGKKKTKTVYKLQFQVTQVPRSKKTTLTISLLPENTGQPTLKLEKAAIQEGICTWENPVYETVKLIRDPKSGKFNELIYHFIVASGSSKAGFLGEASVDFADFAVEIEPVTVSLPLKFANSGAVLHVTIQKISLDGEENEAVTIPDKGSFKLATGSSNALASIWDIDLEDNTDDYGVESNTVNEDPVRNVSFLRMNSMPEKGLVDAKKVHRRSDTDWSLGSASNGSLIDSISSLEHNHPRERLNEASSDLIDKLKSEIASLTRQAELSELELESLRKQIAKESKRGQKLSTQVMCLTEERDELKLDCEKVKSLQQCNNDEITPKQVQLELELEEIRRELSYERELKSNLRMQLRKTQDSNSELILAVRDLESQREILEEKIRDQEQEISDSLVSSKELESQVKDLESQIEKQAQGFEEDLDAMTSSKIEQEQRPIRAEDALRKSRWNNANTAERLQEEFRRLSVEMTSKFEENEKLAMKSMSEANELRSEKRILEQMLEKANEELEQVKEQNGIDLQELLHQIDLQAKELEEMSCAQKHAQELHEASSMEIQTLKDQIETLRMENFSLSEQMNASISETQMLLQRCNEDRDHFERKLSLAKIEVETLQEELTNMRSWNSESDPESMVTTDLKKKVKFLEEQIKQKEAEVEISRNSFQENKRSHNRMVEELKSSMEQFQKDTSNPTGMSHGKVTTLYSVDEFNLGNFLSEVMLLKESNARMERELKEMEERYSEISLKFAEVEGERQQLVMTVRNLKNGKKN